MDEASRPLAAHHWGRVPAIATSLTADRLEHRRRRRTARVVTAVVAVVLGLQVGELVARATSENDFVHRSAALVLLQLGVTTILLGMLLWWAWRRVAEVRPVVLHIDATLAEAVGIPELDAAPRPHLGLHGLVDVPRRF